MEIVWGEPPMAKRTYEGSRVDNAEDARGMRATGMQRQDYEKSARDKREDKAGQKRFAGKKAPPFGKKK